MQNLPPEWPFVEGKCAWHPRASRCRERGFAAVGGDTRTSPSAPAGSERFARSGSVPGDAQIESLRLPPHSVEAEQAVLGGLLLSNSAWDRIGDVISESDFYRADHRILWRTITRLVEENKPADVLTVAEARKQTGEFQDIGGNASLHPLSLGTACAA